MRLAFCLVVASCCGVLAACTAPGPEYHFTAAQLAWQPYQEGQVLRFGNGRTAAVRTYQVTQIVDDMDWDSRAWSFREPPKYQRVNAFLQRTDSVGSEFIAFGLSFDFNYPSAVPGNEFLVIGHLDWDTPPNISGTATLPVDALNQGLPLDTVHYGSVRLLPTYTLGPATYTSVVRYALRISPYSNLANPTTGLYLTKVNDVVGFVQRNVLWYRIP